MAPYGERREAWILCARKDEYPCPDTVGSARLKVNSARYSVRAAEDPPPEREERLGRPGWFPKLALCALLAGAPLAETDSSGSVLDIEPKRSRPVVLPVEGRITSMYGLRRHPVKRVIGKHQGVDIAVPKGTEVKPAASGIVRFSGVRPGYGKVVVLDHGEGVVSVYAHNSRNLVRPDQRVELGDTIALSGSSGRSTGPHLHFELWKDGVNFTDALVRDELPPGFLPEERLAAAEAELLSGEGA
jgi:murein DD-endopeptidase MepM/ murein hydrolase activator NlpD